MMFCPRSSLLELVVLLLLLSFFNSSGLVLTKVTANAKIQKTEAWPCYSNAYHNEVCFDPAAETVANSSGVKIPILYESDRILIINKPPGISHHNDAGITGGQEDDDNVNEQQSSTISSYGIVNLIRQQQNQRLWGVHRLDKVTSGILIFAKDADMAGQLTKLFADNEIQKVYVGISTKRPKKKKQGWIQGGMKKSRDKSWKLTRGDNQKNFAKTRFFTAPVNIQDQKYTCILFRPFTGKTHQLRVAAKSVGIPLLGDPIYKDGTATMTRTIGWRGRTCLHASGIHIPAMEGQPSVSLWCPPPFFLDLVEDAPVLVTTIQKLMQKHCDVPGILRAMEDRDNTNADTIE